MNLYDKIGVDCIQKYLERKEKVMEFQSLSLALLMWIGANSKFNEFETNVELPAVQFVSLAKIHEISGLNAGVGAVYDEVTKTMYLENNFDPKSVVDQGYLMHELLHHVQFENKVPYRRCNKEYEREAYLLTNLWFTQHGLTAPYSETQVLFQWSVCDEKD